MFSKITSPVMQFYKFNVNVGQPLCKLRKKTKEHKVATFTFIFTVSFSNSASYTVPICMLGVRRETAFPERGKTCKGPGFSAVYQITFLSTYIYRMCPQNTKFFWLYITHTQPYRPIARYLFFPDENIPVFRNIQRLGVKGVRWGSEENGNQVEHAIYIM